MGNCMSTIKRRKEPNKAITLAIVGLDNAGKTTICYVLTGEQVDPDLAPTVGFRNVKFSHSNFDVTVFDLGGGESIRPIWKTYFGEVFGLVYVVDSATPSRFNESKEMFQLTLEHPQVSGKPVLILANKVDKEEHMKEADIINALRLENASKCPTKLVLVSALKGVGSKMDKEIEKGLHWLFESIRSSLSSLEPRVQNDMKVANETREKEREERKARVKKQREEREKAEELERTRLGIEKKEDSDEGDIIVGDPFKALDLDKLKKKEQEMKEEKLVVKERKKKLESSGEVRKDNAKMMRSEDIHKTSTSTHEDVAMKDLSISEGLTLHLNEEDYSAVTLVRRRSRTELSPLEPLEPSQHEDNLAKTTSRKKNRKKKRLTDYHLEPHSKQPDGNDLNQGTGADATNTVDFSPRANVLSNGKTNELDQNSPFDKAKKAGARRMSLNTESDPRNKSDETHLSHVGNVDDLNYSKRQQAGHLSSRLQDNKEETSVKSFESVSYDSGDSKYRKSNKQVVLSNLNELGGQETDEGVVISNKSNLEERVMKPKKRLNKNSKSAKSEKVKNSQTNLLSDEENNSYASHNSLKDTLRRPLSPTYVEDLRNSIRGANNSHGQRNNSEDGLNQSKVMKGVENGGFVGRRKSTVNQSKDGADNDSGNSHSYSMPLENRDEAADLTKNEPKKSAVRRKKKHNFLRSNKVTPSDDENIKSANEDFPSSPRVVHESGAKSLPEVKAPAVNRNTTVTSYQRNLSSDSDIGTKWSLAEDLPAVDGSYGGYRLPNFDSNEEGDTVL